MKYRKILGLDIGVSSVGLAVLSENEGVKNIEKLTVRIVPEDTDFHGNFYSGNTASKNLARTEKRGIRRNNQRFKARRDHLYNALKRNHMFPDKGLFNLEAIDLYRLRARAVEEKLTLQELGRVFVMLNQKRGFLSNRKSDSEEENSTEYKDRIAKLESERGGKTIGQAMYKELLASDNVQSVRLRERTYLRASYLEEFDKIWQKQHSFYYEVLTGTVEAENNKGSLYDLFRNQIIYHQRPLKSQKGLVSTCPFEPHHKAVSKSSPYFEQFRIWQKINDLNWNTVTEKERKPSEEQRKELFESLFYGNNLNKHHELSTTGIKKILGFSRSEKIYLSHEELGGSRTYSMLKQALEKADIDPNNYLDFDLTQADQKGGLLELWHITYSSPTNNEMVSALQKRFPFTKAQSEIIAGQVSYKSDYGNLSTRAIRKLLPHLQKGLQYSEACDKIGYDHSGSKTAAATNGKLEPIAKNSLRNPVVEQILNQVVNMVNEAIDAYGPFTEIRVELARELRNSAKARKRISKMIFEGRKENSKIRSRLADDYQFKIVNGRDIKRYKLWEETEQECLYCSQKISNAAFMNGSAEIEHILPKSRSFSNAMSNYILAHKECNSRKGQQTAFDFMKSKGGNDFQTYLEKVNALFEKKNGGISRTKLDNLLCEGDNIPSDFVERMKKDSQYIAKESVKMLKSICENTYTTTGQVTDLLREKWELKHLLQELSIPKYEGINKVGKRNIKDKDGKVIAVPSIEGWTKRDDHRHHAVDALICALTDQKIIFKLNNMNKIYLDKRGALSNEQREELLEEGYDLKIFADQAGYDFPLPMKDLRKQAKEHLEGLFISFKKDSKVLSRSIDKYKKTYWIPRGRLHEETVMGRTKRQVPQKLNAKFNSVDQIVDGEIKNMISKHLMEHDSNPKVAFTAKALKKSPLEHKGKMLSEVMVWEEVGSKRVKLAETFSVKQLSEVIDPGIKAILEERIEAFGSLKNAMKNLNEHPIWQNSEKGISIKSVKVYDTNKAIPLHYKKDHFGEMIQENDELIPVDYVKPGENHHALIYQDEQGNYKERVISFWNAVKLGMLNVEETGSPFPIISRADDVELGKFQFSLQKNDLFVFDLKHSKNPSEENEIDFHELNNRKQISNRLFRLQKMSKKSSGAFEIRFRHHLETQVVRKDKEGKSLDEKELKEVAWIELASRKDLKRLTKIRINHLGDIVHIGE